MKLITKRESETGQFIAKIENIVADSIAATDELAVRLGVHQRAIHFHRKRQILFDTTRNILREGKRGFVLYYPGVLEEFHAGQPAIISLIDRGFPLPLEGKIEISIYTSNSDVIGIELGDDLFEFVPKDCEEVNMSKWLQYFPIDLPPIYDHY